jgi:hypothetical protein
MKGQFFVMATVIMIFTLMALIRYFYDFSDINLPKLKEISELNYIPYIKDSLNSTVNSHTGDCDKLQDDLNFTKIFLESEMIKRGINLTVNYTGYCLPINFNFTIRTSNLYTETVFSTIGEAPPPTCGDTTCEAGEDVNNCPEDCCDPDCTATYDSICYSSCDPYCGTVDLQCNGDIINSCGDSEGDCSGCDYQDCGTETACSSFTGCADDNTRSGTFTDFWCAADSCSSGSQSCTQDCSSPQCCSGGSCVAGGTCSGANICSNSNWIVHCGDLSCNCGETTASCPGDCPYDSGTKCLEDYVIQVKDPAFYNLTGGSCGSDGYYVVRDSEDHTTYGFIVIQTPSLTQEGDYTLNFDEYRGQPLQYYENFTVGCGGEVYDFPDDADTEGWRWRNVICHFNAGVNEFNYTSTDDNSAWFDSFRISA